MKPEGPIALVAGSGRLPIELADHLTQQGSEIRILALRGFADATLRRRAHAVIDVLDPQGILSRLEAWSPRAVALVGGIRRPSFTALLRAYKDLQPMDELRGLFARGDDHVLRGFVAWLEERGIPVVGAHELVPGLTVPSGFQTGAPVSGEHHASIATALRLLDALSPYDIGQGTVIVGQRILAVEGPEGTDRMLRRVAQLRRSWFRRREAGGILVKAAKRGQDLRIDMPAIGPRTVMEAARAGLAGIAVGGASTLILDRAATLQAAERTGLFIVGADPLT